MFQISPIGIDVILDGAVGHDQDDKLFVGRQQVGWHVACIEGVVHAGEDEFACHVGVQTNGSHVGVEGTQPDEQVFFLQLLDVDGVDFLIGDLGIDGAWNNLADSHAGVEGLLNLTLG